VRLLYCNDLHSYGDSEPHYPKTAIAVPRFFELLKEMRNEVDLVIIGGDATNRGPARIEELRWVHARLEDVGIPFQVIAGNHDIAPSEEFAARYPGMEDMEDCPLEETNFGQVFGPQGIRNVLEIDGYRLVFFSLRNHDPDSQIPWVETQLARGGPTILFCHYPIAPSRTGGFCHEWGYSRIGGVRQQLVDLIQRHTDSVRAYFCGHQHINSRTRISNTDQIETGALGLATCCYRLLDFEPAGIRVSTHVLPDIPNWLDDVMNPDRSSDDEHPDLKAYQWGNDDERTFTIPRHPG
jgi:hypothetical protein